MRQRPRPRMPSPRSRRRPRPQRCRRDARNAGSGVAHARRGRRSRHQWRARPLASPSPSLEPSPAASPSPAAAVATRRGPPDRRASNRGADARAAPRPRHPRPRPHRPPPAHTPRHPGTDAARHAQADTQAGGGHPQTQSAEGHRSRPRRQGQGALPGGRSAVRPATTRAPLGRPALHRRQGQDRQRGDLRAAAAGRQRRLGDASGAVAPPTPRALGSRPGPSRGP